MVINSDFWQSKRVAVTGHTGFKGTWLSLWLHSMGASVAGLALAPKTKPAMSELCDLSNTLALETLADIRQMSVVEAFMQEFQPEVIFHLAAQSLVRYSYDSPLETLQTNVLGTANILDASRRLKNPPVIVNVTSDKCYANDESGKPFEESDPMGGNDVYSASKGAAELVAHAYYSSFLKTSGISMASARAGNVIGGGDWAEDRLVPDFFRAHEQNRPLEIRSPNAIRPWQHVLEPLSGYLLLAQSLSEKRLPSGGGWNFGPTEHGIKTVEWVVNHLAQINGGEIVLNNSNKMAEAGVLTLSSKKAEEQLDWHPRWTIEQALEHTSSWEMGRRNGQDPVRLTLNQIDLYMGS